MTDAREITVEEIDEFEHWVCQIYAKAKRAKAICALARRALSQESGLTADEMMGVGKFDPEPYPPSVSVERERETQRLDICASCGQPFRSCKCFNAPDTPQSVPTCTCSKHPLWDGYDGDCPIHGWFEPVAPDTPQSVPAKGDNNGSISPVSNPDGSAVHGGTLTPDAPLSQGEELVPCMDAWCKISPCKCRDGINALIAERDKLKADKDYLRDTLIEVQEYACKENARLKEACDGYLAHAANLRGENAKLEERASVLEGALEEYAAMGDDLGDLARAALRTSEEA
jgi:hypothetical protein